VNYPYPVEFESKLETLPERPGVYIMRDSAQAVIYVGKAVVLRNRVRSYFQASARHEPRTEP
jgi:excinuclease ABC subunit C